MSSTALTRSRTYAATCLLLLAVSGLSACSGDDPTEPAPQESGAAGEPGASDGEVCPAVLPQGDDLGPGGIGTVEPATAAPELPVPEAGFVCLYDAVAASPEESGEEEIYQWARSGAPVEAKKKNLEALSVELAELAPPAPDKTCKTKADERWLFAYTSGEDSIGVVVDDFGCSQVRLSDQPSVTPPGEGQESGTVPGVLLGEYGLLNQIKTVWVEG